jgi:hypothetical protein
VTGVSSQGSKAISSTAQPTSKTSPANSYAANKPAAPCKTSEEDRKKAFEEGQKLQDAIWHVQDGLPASAAGKVSRVLGTINFANPTPAVLEKGRRLFHAAGNIRQGKHDMEGAKAETDAAYAQAKEDAGIVVRELGRAAGTTVEAGLGTGGAITNGFIDGAGHLHEGVGKAVAYGAGSAATTLVKVGLTKGFKELPGFEKVAPNLKTGLDKVGLGDGLAGKDAIPAVKAAAGVAVAAFTKGAQEKVTGMFTGKDKSGEKAEKGAVTQAVKEAGKRIETTETLLQGNVPFTERPAQNAFSNAAGGAVSALIEVYNNHKTPAGAKQH